MSQVNLKSFPIYEFYKEILSYRVRGSMDRKNHHEQGNPKNDSNM